MQKLIELAIWLITVLVSGTADPLPSCDHSVWCTLPHEDLIVHLTVYDPLLCPLGQPCMQGSGDHMFASGIAVDPKYSGHIAACPDYLFGRFISFGYGLDRHVVYCGDTFGYYPDGSRVPTVYLDDYKLSDGSDTWVIGTFVRVDIYLDMSTVDPYSLPWAWYVFGGVEVGGFCNVAYCQPPTDYTGPLPSWGE